ncbi:16S rRNA (adenine(1518)-N(6)/adenine(1519)-N(6))-dimethyltransferase RsmA [Nitriliruptor alkaliphilus]|uniref:16S rRNA (adenine(1518)-N(6)/adenine(1519)-N(6))- dimethyltransferase RsmA n=1 Tax=Nitriliruptor alkaliphilus TaxID=427918 RepID=UPI000696836A|nr:16S rRNA (adenine(1518)-N(6)/adenine(1519)-N(6))-dimethyltransferase RsmA [Nitriliruptor alkaliphilus]
MQRLLREHGLAPRKAAGQNFVVDPNTVRRIVAAADLAPTDTVLEIGPGLGSLTLGLAEAVARVVAVEIDAGMVGALGEVLADVGNVEVVHADALHTALGELVDDGPARLVANLPYNTATPIVMHALADPAVADLFVMVQREVGERWAARPGHPLHAGVSVKLALQADAVVAMTVPRSVFHPVPNVDSVMVRLTRRADAPTGARRERLLAFVDVAFTQRRKTLRNNLRSLAPLEVLTAAADEADIDLGTRAETLDAVAIARLADALEARGRDG